MATNAPQPQSLHPVPLLQRFKQRMGLARPAERPNWLLSSSMAHAGTRNIRERTDMEAKNRRTKTRGLAITPVLLHEIANTDYMISSIIKTLREMVVQVPWHVEADTQDLSGELQRWQDFEVARRKPGGSLLRFEFESNLLAKELQGEVGAALRGIPDNGQYAAQINRVQTVFQQVEMLCEQDAQEEVNTARKFLGSPNEDSNAPWRSLMQATVTDLCIHDAGAIAKNPTERGDRMAELYHVPGDEVILLTYPDQVGKPRPRPPDPAYLWRQEGYDIAYWTTDELVYFVANEQKDGYGFGPVEMAIYMIMGSLQADTFSLDMLRDFNMPPGIMNLGAIESGEREQVAARYDQESRARKKHKMMFISGIEKGALQLLQPKGMTAADINMESYLKWCLLAKCMCFGISPQDVGAVMDFHRTTGEVQERLTKIRAIKSMLDLLAQNLNGGVVKSESGLNCQRARFVWDYEGIDDPMRDAQIDKIDRDSGVSTINDRLKKLGKPPIPGGGVHTINTGMGLIPVIHLGEIQMEEEQPGGGQGLEDQGQTMAGMVVGQSGADLGRVNGEGQLGNIFEAMKAPQDGGQAPQQGQAPPGSPQGQDQQQRAQAAGMKAAGGQMGGSMGKAVGADDDLAKLHAAIAAEDDPKKAARLSEKLTKLLLKRHREAEALEAEGAQAELDADEPAHDAESEAARSEQSLAHARESLSGQAEAEALGLDASAGPSTASGHEVVEGLLALAPRLIDLAVRAAEEGAE
jgi:hypothetical protein